MNDIPLMFENIIEYDGFFWFTEFRYNALYRVRKGNNQAEFMGRFPENTDKARLFIQILSYRNKLIFVPLTSDSIAIYDTNEESFISLLINIPNDEKKTTINYNPNAKFRTGVVVDGYAYLFPVTYPAVLKINLMTYDIEYIYDAINDLKTIHSADSTMYFKNVVPRDGKILGWCLCENGLLEFDVVTNKFNRVYQDETNIKYTDAIIGKDYIWLLPYSKGDKIRKVSLRDKEITDIEIPENILSGNYQFISGFVNNNELWLFPATANSTLAIDCDLNDIRELKSFNSKINFECDYYGENFWKFFFSYISNNNVYLYNYYSQTLIQYDLQREEITEYQITQKSEISEKALQTIANFCKEEWKTSNVVYEDIRLSLNGFIDILTGME